MPKIELSGLTYPWGEDEPPLFDREDWSSGSDELVNEYAENGLVVVEGLAPDHVVDAYCDEWLADSPSPKGWPHVTTYMHQKEMLNLCTQGGIADVLRRILGEPAGLHLNLTGWRSTTRNWHQDGYLNPDTNRDYYVAVWIALDDIHPDSGPFEYVEGSHKVFDVIRNDLMLQALTPEERSSPMWPRFSERILTPIFEDQIDKLGLEVKQFIAKKGDVLFWHPRLLHRGSIPNDVDLERRALIAHYSGISHRPDFPAAVPVGDGWIFPIAD